MTDVATVTTGSVSATGLVDALDRLIAEGVAVSGDVVIGVAGVDLIRLDLRLLLAAAGLDDTHGAEDR